MLRTARAPECDHNHSVRAFTISGYNQIVPKANIFLIHTDIEMTATNEYINVDHKRCHIKTYHKHNFVGLLVFFFYIFFFLVYGDVLNILRTV